MWRALPTNIGLCLILWTFFLAETGGTAITQEPLNPLTPSPGTHQHLSDILDRLPQPAEPVSREGAGKIVVQGPGERYSFSFRLLARDPKTLRLECFDPLGRPMVYLFSLAGKTVLFSPNEKKELPFDPFRLGLWSDFPGLVPEDLLKLFWGRVPLPAYENFEWRSEAKNGRKGIVLSFFGPVLLELRLTPEPLVLEQARFSWSPTKIVEMVFSKFTDISGGRTPLDVEVKAPEGGYTLSIRYDQLVPRSEFPEEIFRYPGTSNHANGTE